MERDLPSPVAKDMALGKCRSVHADNVIISLCAAAGSCDTAPTMTSQRHSPPWAVPDLALRPARSGTSDTRGRRGHGSADGQFP